MAIEKKPEQTNSATPLSGFGQGAGFGAMGAGGMGGIFTMLMDMLQKLLGGGDFMGSLQNIFGGASADASPATASSSPSAPARQPGPPSMRNDFTSSIGLYSPADPKFSSSRALQIARTDNVGEGLCARGTANILRGLGYPVTNANAHDWDVTLPQNDWVRVPGLDAKNAPEGAVLVYDSDVHKGRRPRNDGGGEFGHTEVVCFDAQGNRVFVSDKARKNAGGSVPDNFVGAYVPRERYEAMVAANPQLRGENDRAVAAAATTPVREAKEPTALANAFAPAAQGVSLAANAPVRDQPAAAPTVPQREMALG